jgi:hypothetical protein
VIVTLDLLVVVVVVLMVVAVLKRCEDSYGAAEEDRL